MGPSDQLQDHLARMRAGTPVIPLLPGQAVAQATRLRLAGLTYRDIAKVMALYHGQHKAGEAWRRHIRAQGVPAKHYTNGNLRVPPHLKAAK
jgi:hypothetical protein